MRTRRSQKLTVVIAFAGLTLITLAPARTAAAGITAGMASHPAQAPPARTITSARLAATVRALVPAAYPSWAGRFYSAAATSKRDVWAVGLSAAGGQIAHWNGRSWADYDFSDGYQAVAAQSPSDVWAVGGTSWFYPTQTLARHWNGKTWTQVSTPTPGGSAWFQAVGATSAKNAWAVGCICGGPGAQGYSVPLIEHWNGKTWKQQLFRLPKNSGQLNGVAAISARDAWAVGQTNAGGPSGALVEHWNGYRWQRVQVHTPGRYGFLQGAAATSPGNVWAVGYTNTGPTYQSLILHFNGRRWSVVQSPNPTGQTNLWAVSASSRTNAWAVGYTNPNSCCAETAAFHWNGKGWYVVPSVNPPDEALDALLGVVAISPSDAWAVGTTDWSSTIIEHWGGKAWHT
jgi:hypothetical protein